MTDLKQKFEAEIANVITTTLNETDYRPTYFMNMVSDTGAYDASLRLVRANKPSDGFTKLWELTRLDLTVEAIVIRPEFSELFLDTDVKKAKHRLHEYGYSS